MDVWALNVATKTGVTELPETHKVMWLVAAADAPDISKLGVKNDVWAPLGLNHPVTEKPVPFPTFGVVKAFGLDKYPEFKERSEFPMATEEGSKVAMVPASTLPSYFPKQEAKLAI